MGMALPLAFLLVAAAALLLAFAYVASWGMGSKPGARRRLWRIVMVVTWVLSLGPLLLSAASAVDEMVSGANPAVPLGVFVAVAVIPVLAYFKFRYERRSARL